MKKVLNYFLRGLLFVLPVALTLYIIVSLVQWANNFFNELFNVTIPGLGIVAVFFAIALIGYLFSRAFIKPVVAYCDRLLARVPLVKIIYTALKELTQAFVGDKKKFSNPVLADFKLSDEVTMKRVGFITQDDLSVFGLNDMVTVYCPHSYNISGNVYIMPAKAVTPLEVDSSEVMKYAMSGGVTKLKTANGKRETADGKR